MNNASDFLKTVKEGLVQIVFDDKDVAMVTLSSKVAGRKITNVKQQASNTFLVVWDMKTKDWYCFEQDRVIEWNRLF